MTSLRTSKRSRLILAALLFSYSLIIPFSLAQDAQEPLYLRDALPQQPGTLQLDDSFKTNLFTGSFTYTYPIQVPRGTNSLQPHLSLFYNSQKTTSTPGVLGTAWDITQSYIQRNVNATVNNTADDFFTLILDGVSYELVYSADDNRYHTVVETFLFIQNRTTFTNQWGQYWIVKTKDGTTYRMGFNNDSEMPSQQGNFTWRWSLDTISDTYNNTIFYSYAENPFPNDAGAAYLVNITYNNDRLRLINFTYEQKERPDFWGIYVNGNRLNQTRRLQEITVTSNNTLVRGYRLGYASLSTARSFLSNITLIGNDGTSTLPPTTFLYQPNGTGWTGNNATWWPPICLADDATGFDEGVRLVDVTGDGLPDVLRATQGANCANAQDLEARISNGKGSWITNANYYPTRCIIGLYNGDEGTRMFDANGDGLPDILHSIHDTGNCGPNEQIAYVNNGNGWTEDATWTPPICFVGPDGDEGVRFADVNGDGLVDILRSRGGFVYSTCVPDTTKSWAYINNGHGWTRNDAWASPLCFAYSSSPSKDSGTRIVDVNGDGLVDIVAAQVAEPIGNQCNQIGGYQEFAYLNNGSGWVLAPQWKPPICFVSGQDEGVRLADVNGDGLVDIISKKGDHDPLSEDCGSTVTTNYAYINNGSGWEEMPGWRSPLCFTGSTGKDLGVRITDVNGDGQADLVRAGGTGNCVATHQQARLNKAGPSFLLVYINNSLGGSTSVRHTDSASLNNHGNVSVAVGDLAFNLWVVKSVTQHNGMSGTANITATTTYNYSGGFYDYRKADFKGFAFAQEVRPDGTIVNHSFHQDDGRLGREYRVDSADAWSALFQRREFLWTFTANHTSSNTTYYVTQLREENTSAYDGNAAMPLVSKVTYRYDSFGNTIEKFSLGDASVTGDERYESAQFIANTSSWILDKPTRTLLVAADNVTTLRDVNYSYDNLSYGSAPIKGSVTRKVDFLAGGSNPVTTFDYDSHGNMNKQTDPNGHITRFAYGGVDTTFTFPDSQINALGHITRYTYNLGFGKPTSVTDPNGFVTNYTYDTFGRLSKEIKPYDTFSQPTTSYAYSDDGIAPQTLSISRREQNGTTNTYLTFQFYDGFAQLTQTRADAEGGDHIVTNQFYDGLGRLVQKSNPYVSFFSAVYLPPNASVNVTTIAYDPLDRITQTTNPDGTVRTVTYSRANTTLADENGNEHIQTRNGLGKITHIYEITPQGTYLTRYHYSAAGELTNITDSEGRAFDFTYDTLGRKTRQDDPDLGTWTYAYDSAGNLIQQTDARGIITSQQFDELNRLTSKNSSAEFVVYTYDRFLNGTLSGVQSTDYVTNLSYDNRLRTIREIKTITGNSSTTSFAYDSMDRTTSVTLPDGNAITYTYSDQNQLETIAGIISDFNYTALGTIQQRAYANGLSSSFSYDPENLRLTRIKTHPAQNLSYTYDNASNVLSITDHMNSVTLTLSYDSLNRLVLATRTDSGKNRQTFDHNYTYSPTGNLLRILANNKNINTSYFYGQFPAHAPSELLQTGPRLQVTNLKLLSENTTFKVWRFDLRNNGQTNLSNLNWTLYTGEQVIRNQLAFNLSIGEDMFVFVTANYSKPSASYVTVATANGLSIYDTESSHQFLADPNVTSTRTYDANGNLIQDGAFSYEYNNFNQLSRVRESNTSGPVVEEYLYDQEGQRILKRNATSTLFYINKYFLRSLAGTQPKDTTYYYDNKDTLLARKDPDGRTFFYHPDHLGSTTLVTNSTGNVVEETNYFPYGAPIYDGESRYLFTGKELDRGTGLQYFGARYYDAQLGRFIQPDSNIPSQYNPHALNRYSYAYNSPLQYTDPDGNSPQSSFALGFMISVGMDLVTTRRVDLGKAFVSGTTAIAGEQIGQHGKILGILSGNPATAPLATRVPVREIGNRIGLGPLVSSVVTRDPTVLQLTFNTLANPTRTSFLPNLASDALTAAQSDRFLNRELGPVLDFNRLQVSHIPLPDMYDTVYQYEQPRVLNVDKHTFSGGGFRRVYYPSDRMSYEEYVKESEDCRCSPNG